MKEKTIQKSREDIEKELKIQLKFLKSSCDTFDNGDTDEAKRLASTLRLLLHDTGKSKSLLGQLGLKNILFLSTNHVYNELSISSFSGLTNILLGEGKVSYIAPLDDDLSLHRSNSFDEWWNEIIFSDDKKQILTRRDLIMEMADKDGGAHVDPELTEKYSELTKNNSMGHMMNTGSLWKDMQDIERFSVRQIAHEVIKTLDPSYTKKIRIKESGFITGGSMVLGGLPNDVLVPKVGRNDLCPCGSEVKYKYCHGR